MKTILMSIQPKWCEKIFNGEKKIEVRKTAPKPPFKVVVYCTKDNTKIYLGEDRIFHTNCAYDFETGEILENILMNGKVIGEFVCNKVEAIPVDSEAFATISKPACLTTDELIEYCSGKDMYGIHITDLNIYDKPKELGEFRKPCGNCIVKCKGEHYDRCPWRTITRPPQSWMYVEK